MNSYHIPVMLSECLDYLKVQDGKVYVDGTLGGGGHTEAILSAAKCTVYAFDQDEEAIHYASDRLKPYSDRVNLIHANFEQMRTELALRRVKGVDGVLLDLGVSSHQIDAAERGFSFDQNGEMDMRMDSRSETTAAHIVNTADMPELARIFRVYGEEQNAGKVAQWIVEAREVKPFETTAELSNLIESRMKANPVFVTKTKARVFQALRISINRELDVLERAIRDAVYLLNPGGRIVIMSYHSLEDKIAKSLYQEYAKGCICPTQILKCVCGRQPLLKILTNKPIVPAEAEQRDNSRSRSAKLRAAEKK